MYLQFTDSARNAFAVANREAQALRHEYIGSGHILLGLLAETSGATGILKDAHLDPETVRFIATKLLVDTATTSVTDDAKSVVQATLEEARRLEHGVVDTAHILLGILGSPGSLAATVFDRLCSDTEPLRRAALRRVEDYPKVKYSRWDQHKHHPEIKPLVDRLDHLQQLKETAISEGSFEEAARLRDQGDQLKREINTVLQRIEGHGPK